MVIVAATVFVLFGIDLYKRKKMNILHFIVFFLWWGLVIMFGFNQTLLDQFGKFFGIARGADLLVYISLILLFYFYIDVLNKHTKDKFQLTRLISQDAIRKGYLVNQEFLQQRVNTNEKDQFVFNIRVYNEEEAIGKVIDEIISYGFSKIVLINDGSSDNSLSVLEKKRKQYPDKMLIVLSHTINRGGGAANQTGYNFIKKYGDEMKVRRFVGYDADGQMDIKDMDIFMKRISHNEKFGLDLENKKPSVYLGSRFIIGGKADNIPLFRRMILFIAQIVTKVFYGASISDPHNGYRVMALASLRKISLTSDGMHYANELNEQIKRNKLRYEEVPVHIRYTDYSLHKWHRQTNSNSLKLAAEMIYKKVFFR
jgi:polyprenyl-phospho-N-acetylgalactosaminyl synthase